jgi:hypothetical protein
MTANSTQSDIQFMHHNFHSVIGLFLYKVLRWLSKWLAPFHWILCSLVRASWISVNNCPTRCDFVQFLFPANCSTCFRWHLHPSSGARAWAPILIPQWQRKVAYSVRCCNYSLLALLMMGEGVTWNMYSSLQGIKSVHSRILLDSYWHSLSLSFIFATEKYWTL